MNNHKPLLIMGAVTLIIIGGLTTAYAFMRSDVPASPQLASFAECIRDSGAKFYGAFWCGHCQNQKRMFGAAAEFIPYVECSSPDGQRQLDVCKEANIEAYPTWVFPQGEPVSGEVPFSTIAERTGCALPTAGGQ